MKSIAKFPGREAANIILLAFVMNIAVACGGGDLRAETEKDSALRSADEDTSGKQALKFVVWRERLHDGQPLAIKDYEARVIACNGAGLPVKALSSDELAKAGKHQSEVWTDGARYQISDVEWGWRTPSPGSPETSCQFEFYEHRRDTQSNGKDVRVRSNFPGEAESETQQDAGVRMALASEDVAQAREDSLGIGWAALGTSQKKGQPCSRWKKDETEVCMWSGGAAWGISEAATGDDCQLGQTGEAFLDALPLTASNSVQAGSGCRLEVASISIGGAAVTPPDGIDKEGE